MGRPVGVAAPVKKPLRSDAHAGQRDRARSIWAATSGADEAYRDRCADAGAVESAFAKECWPLGRMQRGTVSIRRGETGVGFAQISFRQTPRLGLGGISREENGRDPSRYPGP